MLTALTLLLAAGSIFAPGQPWSLGFANPPRIPLAGDVDADGYTDLLCVYAPGDSIVDVSLNSLGQKMTLGFQGATKWGKDCQAAVMGPFDESPGDDVLGLFQGRVLRLAGEFKDRKFKDTAEWIVLPKGVDAPLMGRFGNRVFVWSKGDGNGFRIDSRSKRLTGVKLPKELVWLGDAGSSPAGQLADGRVVLLNRDATRVEKVLGRIDPQSKPAAAPGMVAFGRTVWRAGKGAIKLVSELPEVTSVLQIGDFDKDNDLDVVEYRYGSEKHTGTAITLYRAISADESDPDKDGVSTASEKLLGTDPLNPDTDNDGLLDGWEIGIYRGLDLRALGCSPRRIDILIQVRRFESVDEQQVAKELGRIRGYFRNLPVMNIDGTTGWQLHTVVEAPITGDDTKQSWWSNRDKFLPRKWRGLMHFMQIGPGGGGQADQLGDGGGCGNQNIYATFTHELGHQLGMDHNGFWEPGLCPIYRSMMNYAYSYSVEDDPNKIGFSTGELKDFVLRETDLDEELPLPYEQAKFLEKGPYRFRLKPNGKTTLIDWNWNGIFGEKHIRADINYSYSTSAGRRDDVGKTHSAPSVFVHQGSAFVAYVVRPEYKVDSKIDPTVAVDRPGSLTLRKLVKPFEWEKPVTIVAEGVIGDPTAISTGENIVLAYQGSAGVHLITWTSNATTAHPVLIDTNPKVVPTLAEVGNSRFLFLWNPDTLEVSVSRVDESGRPDAAKALGLKSTTPVGATLDTIKNEVVLGLAQDQDKDRPSRWQIRRYKVDGDRWTEQSMEWVEGEKGGARGNFRCTLLFDSSKDAGPEGRVYYFARGYTLKGEGWACAYVSHQIADKTVKGGWLTKRFYDEWTQTRSAPSACWFDGDILYAYRWVDGGQGSTDNNLHIGYKGLAIDDTPMGDHDDLAFFRNFGIRHSILRLAE